MIRVSSKYGFSIEYTRSAWIQTRIYLLCIAVGRCFEVFSRNDRINSKTARMNPSSPPRPSNVLVFIILCSAIPSPKRGRKKKKRHSESLTALGSHGALYPLCSRRYVKIIRKTRTATYNSSAATRAKQRAEMSCKNYLNTNPKVAAAAKWPPTRTKPKSHNVHVRV